MLTKTWFKNEDWQIVLLTFIDAAFFFFLPSECFPPGKTPGMLVGYQFSF